MTVYNDLIDELKADDLLEGAGTGTVDCGKDSETNSILKELAALEESGDPVNLDSDKLRDQENEAALPDIQKPLGKSDFFRKRAMDEVSSLQMVEHVISSIERGHMKIDRAAFNDLEVKKALHRFLQISDHRSPQHTECEYLLLQETESWSFEMAERDNQIAVGNIRRFCEQSRPALSSQALMALARFYRNSPYSESVRGKFDVVMTRLFSRDFDDQSRRLIFPRKEIASHIQTLYSNWSSILMFSAEENAEEVAVAVSRFEALMVEAESAETLDQLLEADFFGQLRQHKESAADLFYVPEVCAAAIDCNVCVGNKYVDLVLSEKAKSKIAIVEEKYGFTHDQIVSNSVSKTLVLVNLLNSVPNDSGFEGDGASFDEVFPDERGAADNSRKNSAGSRYEIFGVNKWLMAVAFMMLSISIGLYFWAESSAGAQSGAVIAAEIDLGGSEIKQHLQAARGSGETFYGILQPTWDAMSPEQQKAFLQATFTYSKEKGFKRVNLLNRRGRTVGFASEEKSEILKP